MKWMGSILIAALLGVTQTMAGEFYSVEKIQYLKKEPKKGGAVFKESFKLDKDGKPTKEKEFTFIPCLAVRVSVEGQVKADTTFAKAYFYDSAGQLIDKVEKPSAVDRGARNMYATPVFYKKSEKEIVFFALPEKVQKFSGEWIALVVFGDTQGVGGETMPSGKLIDTYDFPEKELYLKRNERVVRKSTMDPVVEYVIKTKVPEQPQITLFLRPPIGMTDASEAKGVLAMCVIAGSVEEIKRRLQGIESGQEMSSLLKFAEKHKLIILCWGSKGVREPGSTWDEMDKETNKKQEETFDDLADKWAQGVETLVRKYGIPNKNFLLSGSSDSAQYALRLALRKPEYFLGVHCHIPNGFDLPRPESNRVLWCLTTGELDFCYERSIRFYMKAREMGYPIIYKAIIGLGHSGHHLSENLSIQFFEWCLTMKEQKELYEASLLDEFGNPIPKDIGEPPKPWPEKFQNPPFYGDIVNQEMFPADKRDMVPRGFQVPLPTKELAEAWNKK